MKYLSKYDLNKGFTSLVLLASLMVFSACEADDDQQVTTYTNLVMADEFNTNGAPNSSIWTYDIGDGSAEGIPGWGNSELQYYTDRSDNVTVTNGYLLITAKKEDYQGASYTSARIKTEGKFTQQYGRVEARIQLPTGKGLLPAFWMLGDDEGGTLEWPNRGEIDIMEFVGDKPNEVFGTLHGPGYSAGESISEKYTLLNGRFDTGFHVYGMEWGPDYVNFYVDDFLYGRITPEDVPGDWVFDRPFHIILNIAVGGNLPGNPDDSTIFPQTMLVDYVRVYN